MKLTIHRGTKEIGGSCVEVSTATTRIVLDAGIPLVQSDRAPFDPKTMRGKSALELIQEKTIPNVQGLFTAGPSPDAILLSHSHPDHAGLLHLTRPQIPIYATSGTSKMMLAAAIFSRQESIDKARHRTISPKQSFTIGDITITAFSVDHSTFGSVAFLIEADGKTIFYSGDIRRHGRKPGMARDLVAQTCNRSIDVMLMEGTHFGSGRSTHGLTEFELEESIVTHVKSAPGLVLACFTPIDLDRLVTYYRASRRSGRIFVADAYAAFVMHLLASETAIPRPTDDAGVRVYFNRAFEDRKLTKVAETFGPVDRISLDRVRSEPARYLMVFRPSMTKLDFDNMLPPNCRCLYSYWNGYLTKPEWVQLQQDVKQVGGDFIPAHTSGHIYVDDIVGLVQAINPKCIIPIHTFAPTAFLQHFQNVQLLNDGEPHLIN